jgi:hypothetical protein
LYRDDGDSNGDGQYELFFFLVLENMTLNCVAPEPEGSSPCSQKPANDPYPEPGESTPQPSI